MAERSSSTEVKSEERGPHWVAWIPDADGKPLSSVVLVGRNRQEAVDRARRWAGLESTS